MRKRERESSRRIGIGRWTLWAAAALFVVAASPSGAAPGDKEAEIKAVKHRIREHLEEAKELRRRGEVERAEEHEQEAKELTRRLKEHFARRKDGREGLEHWRKVLAGLEHGIAALEELKQHEEAQRLTRIADDLRRRLEAETEPRRDGHQRELEIVRRRLQVMRYGVEGLVEANKREAADQLERAMHALELAAAGKHSTEAMHIRKSAPKLGQQVELLLFASRVLREQGKHDRADLVGKLGREMQAQWKREHAREREREEREHREKREPGPEWGERLERIEREIGELGGLVREFERHAGAIRELSQAHRQLAERIERLEAELNEMGGRRRR